MDARTTAAISTLLALLETAKRKLHAELAAAGDAVAAAREADELRARISAVIEIAQELDGTRAAIRVVAAWL